MWSIWHERKTYTLEDPLHQQTLYEEHGARLLPSRTPHPGCWERQNASCRQSNTPLKVAWRGSLARRRRSLLQPGREVSRGTKELDASHLLARGGEGGWYTGDGGHGECNAENGECKTEYTSNLYWCGRAEVRWFLCVVGCIACIWLIQRQQGVTRRVVVTCCGPH